MIPSETKEFYEEKRFVEISNEGESKELNIDSA